jgi:hypothetical protein
MPARMHIGLDRFTPATTLLLHVHPPLARIVWARSDQGTVGGEDRVPVTHTRAGSTAAAWQIKFKRQVDLN